MGRSSPDSLLLGEWACLGILCASPRHGFAVAARLRPDADLGRIWSMSRALTYRSLDQLVARGLVAERGHEPGVAGGTRTILGATRGGRTALRRWVTSPVEHVRDLRTELLLKVVLADETGTDIREMLEAQHGRLSTLVANLKGQHADSDIVHDWRCEAAAAALRFVERCIDRADPAA